MKHKPAIVVTIGVFDGVHRGHRALIRRTVNLAGKIKASPLAVTFQDHPAYVLNGGPRIPFLLPRRETFRLMKKEGVKRLKVLRFTKAFSRKNPEQFVLWLKTLGDLKGVVVGENFRFGQGAKGEVKLLGSLGRRYGFKVMIVKRVRFQHHIVSSTLIRGLLSEGMTGRANQLLGRVYYIEGDVAHGKRVGRQLGFPTANLRVEQWLPRDGVYACAVRLGKKYYRAGMNLGKRPTFKNDDHHRTAEVHLLHYYGKLYGKRLRVYLLKYLRAEKKFLTPTGLVKQIEKDLAQVQKCPLEGLKVI